MSKLYIVATPIGNLNDITSRALNILNTCDLILCEDTLHSLKLLNFYNIKKKLIPYHKFNEENQSKNIIKKMSNSNMNVALITDAGTPCISDPGYEIVKLAHENSIEVLAIPGASALISALSICGLNTNNFSFYGFFPRENSKKNKLIEEITKSSINTIAFYESPKRLLNTLNFIKGKIKINLIAVCSELTKVHEKVYYGTIDKIIEEITINDKDIRGEYVVLIEKEHEEIKQNLELSLEALLIDVVVKNNVSLKEATAKLYLTNPNQSKKDIYQAALNLKKHFNS